MSTLTQEVRKALGEALGDEVEMDAKHFTLLNKLCYRVEDLESGLEAIKCLNKFTLIGDHGSYSDGAHSAFCQASEMAEEYLSGSSEGSSDRPKD